MPNKSGASQDIHSLLDAAGKAIDAIKLNTITTRRHRGWPVRVKRRNRGSDQIASMANLFFLLAKAPIRVLNQLEEWQQWEVACFQLLNGDEFSAFACGPRTVCADRLPGRSLRKLSNIKKLKRKAIEAAARETRRVHSLYFEAFHGPWSHGDLHMGNVIYDETTNRARLIDFEIVHQRTLSRRARHADDLLGFLQDMVGTVPAKQWLPFALCFLKAYDRPDVVARLEKLLVIPHGMPGFWWTIRSNFLDRAKIERRMGALRRALQPYLAQKPHSKRRGVR